MKFKTDLYSVSIPYEAGFKKQKKRSLEYDQPVLAVQEQTQSIDNAPGTRQASSSKQTGKHRAEEPQQSTTAEQMVHKMKHVYNLRSYSKSGAPRIQVPVASSSKIQSSSQSNLTKDRIHIEDIHEDDVVQKGSTTAQSTSRDISNVQADEEGDAEDDHIPISWDEFGESELADLQDFYDEVEVEPNRDQRDLTWLNDSKFKQLDLNDNDLVFIAIDPGVNFLATVVHVKAEEGRSAMEILEEKLRQPKSQGVYAQMIRTSDYYDAVSAQLTAEEQKLCQDVYSTPKKELWHDFGNWQQYSRSGRSLRYGLAALLSEKDSLSIASLKLHSGYVNKACLNPSTMFTNGSLALAKCPGFYIGVNRYLCMFHLKENMARNCRELVANYNAVELEFICLASIVDQNQLQPWRNKFLTIIRNAVHICNALQVDVIQRNGL
ncbi:hypothetical protein MP228_006372 [Amoeboaphelidium protococcarum]|nr:hypothetical protein MP228_006372 [Amoeboaphelidium protococcarum]